MAVSIVDMAQGNVKASSVVKILHLVFSIIDPPYAVLGGLYFMNRVSSQFFSENTGSITLAEKRQ